MFLLLGEESMLDQSARLRKIYKMLRLANPHEEDVPHKPPKYYVCYFKTDKLNKYAVSVSLFVLILYDHMKRLLIDCRQGVYSGKSDCLVLPKNTWLLALKNRQKN